MGWVKVRGGTFLALVVLVGGLLAGCELPTNVLSGRLLVEGTSTPAAGATVEVYDDATETVVAQTVAGANGRYALSTAQLPDGDYRIRLSPTEWWEDASDWAGATVVAVSEAAPLVIDTSITLVTGTLTGAVTDGTTGLEAATVQARSTTTGAAIATTTTAADGSFTFPSIAVGAYRLHVEATGYATADPTATHTVTDGEETAAGTVALTPDAVLTGIVTDGGAPAPGVLVITQQPATGALISTITDANGAFALRGLSAAAHPIFLADTTPTLRLVTANDGGTPATTTLFTPEPGEHLHTGTIDLETGATTPIGISNLDDGAFHLCSLDAAGTIICWGANYYGHTVAPGGEFTKLSAFGDLTCGLRPDGAMVCFGTDGFSGNGAAGALAGTFVDVHVGGNLFYGGSPCGIRDTGALVCGWGASTTSPITGTFSSLGTGSGRLACAIRTDRTIACWGTHAALTSPPPGTFRAVTNGTLHACGIRTDRTLACWGNNDYGQTDAIPTGEFLTLSAGARHTCALATNLSVRCWGDDARGQATAPGGAFVEVVANESRTCALTTGGQPVCWGNGAVGAVAPSPGSYSTAWASQGWACALDIAGAAACWGISGGPAPAAIASEVVIDLAPNDQDWCALIEAGSITCWRPGSTTPPTPPPGAFTSVDAGSNHWCAVAVGGSISCWGDNTAGKATPSPGSYTAVSAGPEHTCAIAGDGTLACWGDDTSGEASPPPGAYTDVATGTRHSCALDATGTISCWGDSTFGLTSPPPGTFVDVDIAGLSSCAVSTDGSVQCWGPAIFASYGTPAPPSTGSYTSITSTTGRSSYAGFCATRSDGAYQCWGGMTVIGWLYD